MDAETGFQTFAAKPDPWGKIGGMVVINMDDCLGRLEQFMEQTGRFLPKGKLHRLSAVIGTDLPDYGKTPWFTARTAERARFWAGTAGCALSHRRAIERAQAEGWDNVLILEDDACLLPNAGGWEALPHALEHMQAQDLLYLGHHRPVPYGCLLGTQGKGHLWQVEGVLATHAYIMASGLYEPALSLLPQERDIWAWVARHKAIDVMYRDFLPTLPGVRVTALYPQLFNQGTRTSGIGGNAVGNEDYDCPRQPYPYQSLAGWGHRMLQPLRRIKTHLNAHRRYHRAYWGGLPGYRKHTPSPGTHS